MLEGVCTPSRDRLSAQVTRSLHDALEETLGFIQRALDRIRAGEGAEVELHNVRAYLLNILELVERDPGIEAASDDLYAVAKELAATCLTPPARLPERRAGSFPASVWPNL
jgi:hypothetical protein